MCRAALLGLLIVAGWAGQKAAAEPAAEFRLVQRVADQPHAAVVVQAPRGVPVVEQVDVAVVGGGLAGYAAALHVAQAGLSVVLVEERNQLGHEYTTTFKTTVAPRRAPVESPLTKDLCDHLELRGVMGPAGIEPLALVTHLPEHSTLRRKVRTYLFSLPAGVVRREGRVAGVIVVNRSGRQIVLAKAIVDATDDARVAAAAGAEIVQPPPGPVTVRRFLLGSVKPPWPAGPLTLPAGRGLDDDQAIVHALGVELITRLEPRPDRAETLTAALTATLEKAFRLRAHAQEEGRAWKEFAPAPEVLIDRVPQVRCRADTSAADLAALRWNNPDALRPAGVEGVLVAGRAGLPIGAAVDLETLLAHGEAAGRAAVALANATTLPALPETQLPPALAPAPGLTVGEVLDGPQRGVDYPRLAQPAVNLPVVGRCDVLVVGGGTSGALAAIAAARQGARVVLVEVLPNLGGTSSNRVNSYYWGVAWKSRLSEEIDRQIHATPRTDPGSAEKVRFSGEEKKWVLQSLAQQAGVRLWLRTFAAGAVVDGRRVAGAVIESAAGRAVVLADVVIDATGHADVAAAAGAAFDKGRPSDGFLHEMEYGPLRDPLDVVDTSKAYLRMPVKVPSHNLRESRRIVGDYRLTFDDQIRQRRFDDVVCCWRANYDTHFPHSANEEDLAQDWMAILGLFRRPIHGSIPYRCLLPQGWEHILVVGKAYSVTHDALIGARMQRDLQHLGEAAGVAAALASRQKQSCRQISVPALQQELVRLGVLRPEDLPAAARTPPPLDVAAAVARLGSESALDAMVDLYLEGPAAAPALRPLLDSPERRTREEAALVLGLMQDRAAIPPLLEFVRQRNKRTLTATWPRANSIASMPLYYSAVILLGRLQAGEAAPLLRELIASPEECPPQLAALCIVALGRIGDRASIAAIQPYLRVAQSAMIYKENTTADGQWGVRTTAARVLAQLGDRSGVPVLIGLLEADQALLRDYALRLLEQITGQHFGKDRRRWEAWWQTQ